MILTTRGRWKISAAATMTRTAHSPPNAGFRMGENFRSLAACNKQNKAAEMAIPMTAKAYQRRSMNANHR